MYKFIGVNYIILVFSFFSQTTQSAESPMISLDSLERVTQELVAPPFLPEHTQIASSEPNPSLSAGLIIFL